MLNYIGKDGTKMRKLRNLDQIEEEYLREHPKEIDEYLLVLFEEYAEDHDIGAFLSSLRVVCRVVGIGELAKKSGLTRKGLQKALSEKGNPRLENFNAIMQAMGYRLVPQKL